MQLRRVGCPWSEMQGVEASRKKEEGRRKKVVVSAPSFLGSAVFLVLSGVFRGLLAHGLPSFCPGPGLPGALSGKP